VFGVLAFGTVWPVFVSGVRQVLDQVLDPVEEGDARVPVVGDLVDEYSQVLVEQLARDRDRTRLSPTRSRTRARRLVNTSCSSHGGGRA
jgi:hypothetical protein